MSNRTRMHVLIPHGVGSSSLCNKTRKGFQIRKDRIKLSLSADDIFINVDNPKESTKKNTPQTPRIREFSKVASYKINTQK